MAVDRAIERDPGPPNSLPAPSGEPDDFLAGRARQLAITPGEAALRDAQLTERNPFSLDDAAAISGGARIYALHCAGCHGDRADGRGSAARRGTSPENFHALGERLKVALGTAPSSWFEAVSEGSGELVDDDSASFAVPQREMPAYGDTLANEQIWMVLTYLASNE
jgi:mono/diheme cytochrome c family protein